MRRWLKLDAKNRAWRTILQGLVAFVLVPGGTVLVEAVRVYLIKPDAGFNLQVVGAAMLFEALTAATMAITAYLHRLKLDPAAIPSAQPPRPMGVTEAQAPATAPVSPVAKP